MNKYFRPAVVEDFQEPQIEVRTGLYISTSQKEKIAAGEMKQVIEDLHRMFGISRIQLKQKCMEYQYFLQAKADFEKGNPVFVPYNPKYS